MGEQRGTLLRLWTCPYLLRIAAMRRPKGLSAQTEIVREVISERVISSAVRALPDDLFFERPAAARREELTELLISRRSVICARRVVEQFHTDGDALVPGGRCPAPAPRSTG